MRGINGGQLPPRLRQAADRFSRWRNAHELGTRIPERLWELAVELAGIHGASRTASALSLDYYSLKNHLEDSTSSAVRASLSEDSPAFVELSPSHLSTPGECVIDLENSRGAKMRVHLKGMATPDLVALIRSFWSTE